jgi:hypothetical protein
MRVFVAGALLFAALLFPKSGAAQAYQVRTPAPDVTAADAEWQVASDPIVVQGLLFYPTRETRMFDGQIMAQIGVYERVPVYADVTLEPFGIIYVPIGGQRMRTYERKREGELAGTTGSRTPSFPVDVASATTAEPRPIATGGSMVPAGIDRSATPSPIERDGAPASSAVPRRARVETIPTPRRAVRNGIWIEFNGARWYNDGAAVSYSADRFTPVGAYHGFPVYRDRKGPAGDIWVQVVEDGPLAPYRKR